MLGHRLFLNCFDMARVFAGKHTLRHIVSEVHDLSLAPALAVTVPTREDGIDLTRIIHHELLDSRAPTGTGSPDLVDALEKRKPGKGVTLSNAL